MVLLLLYVLLPLSVWTIMRIRIKGKSVVAEKAQFFFDVSNKRHKYYIIIKPKINKKELIELLAKCQGFEKCYQVSKDTFIATLSDKEDAIRSIEGIDECISAIYINNGEDFTPDDLFELLFNGLKSARRSGRSTTEMIDFDGEVFLKRLGFTKKGFVPYFQPVIEHRKVIGLESLGRWNSTTEIFPPSVFLPVAIRQKIIQSLDLRLITESVKNFSYLGLHHDMSEMELHLNVARESLDNKFVDRMNGISKIFPDIKNGNIVFDVDNDSLDIEEVQELRKQGYKVSVKLSRQNTSKLLENFNYDVLKIESKLLATLSPFDVEALKTENVELIGVFIETKQHESEFHYQGIYKNQGFLYSEPGGVIDAMKIMEVSL